MATGRVKARLSGQSEETNGTNKTNAEAIIASRVVNASKSPDRYYLNNNMVVNLGPSTNESPYSNK